MIFKVIENNDWGLKRKSNIDDRVIKRTVIMFIDNADFLKSGRNTVSNMQNMMDIHANYYEGIGSKLQ